MLSADSASPGDALQAQLEWSTPRQLETRYKVSVQLVSSDWRVVAQHDGEPGGDQKPTTAWQPGQTIADNHALILPEDLPAGLYSLIIVVYELNPPYSRLLVETADTPESRDYLMLAAIRVED